MRGVLDRKPFLYSCRKSPDSRALLVEDRKLFNLVSVQGKHRHLTLYGSPGFRQHGEASLMMVRNKAQTSTIYVRECHLPVNLSAKPSHRRGFETSACPSVACTEI